MQDAAWDGAGDLRARFKPAPQSWLVLALTAFGTLGVIYGDIGTSPLYTFSSIFASVDTPDADDAKMGLSLIFWTITLVVMFKYVLVVLRADDNGEGGTFALYSRLCRSLGVSPFGTLQAREHEQLVTISKRAPPAPATSRISRLSRSIAHMRLQTPSSRFQPSLTSQHPPPGGSAPSNTATSPTGAGVPLTTHSRLPHAMHLNPHAALPEHASFCEALEEGRVALRAPTTTFAPAGPGAGAGGMPQHRGGAGKLDSSDGGEAMATGGGTVSRRRQRGGVGVKDVGVRIPSTTNLAVEGVEGGGHAPRRWWNRGALPAEPFKRWVRGSVFAQRTLLIISISATSLVLGDGVLTPAVSVVSAISGLTVATDAVTQDMVVGISCAIIVVLFSFQHFGTDRVSFIFSPIVALWLASNAAIGVYNLAKNGAEALEGLSPYWIGMFFQRYGGATGWQMLGSVMLCVTGAEALFADLGHFNVASITLSWSTYVYPCLILTYVGQTSHLIHNPDAMSNVYWETVPHSVFWPMLILATLASIVASQALISASFSICSQARALGCFPKVQLINTSPHHHGQIYVPFVNYTLMVLTVAVIAGFNGNGTHLGNAYGLTISAVMFITTIYIVVLAVVDWRVNFAAVVVFGVVYGIIDGIFFSANLTKVPKGGWVALAIGGGVALVNLTWWAGQRRRRHVIAKLERDTVDAQPFTYVAKPGNNGGDGGNKDAAGNGTVSYSGHTQAGMLYPSMSGGVGNNNNATVAASATSVSPHPLALQAQPSEPLAMGVGVGTTTPQAGGVLRAGSGAPGAGAGVAPGGGLQAQPSVLSKYWGLQASTPNAFDLGMLRGDLVLALKQPNSNLASTLVTMPGIALHYSDDSVSAISAVLRHVINNQEAIHEINVLVAVRRLPVPRIGDDDRLLVRTLAQLPSFYQVIARYGYLDTVDHGPDFINDLLRAVVAVLADSAGVRAVKTNLDAVVEAAPPPPAPETRGRLSVPEEMMDVTSTGQEDFRSPTPSLATLSRALPATDSQQQHTGAGTLHASSFHMMSPLGRGESGPAVEIQVASPLAAMGAAGDRGPLLSARSVPAGAQRMSLDLATLSRTVQQSHLGRTLSRVTSHHHRHMTAPGTALGLGLGALPSFASGGAGGGAGGGSLAPGGLMTPPQGSLTAPHLQQHPPAPPEAPLQLHLPAGAILGDPMDYLNEMAALAQSGESLPPELEEAALRVSALLKAAKAGCVYYFSRTSLRMDPHNNLFRRILMEQLFRPMLLLAYADHEEWHVPLEHLIELGMAIRV